MALLRSNVVFPLDRAVRAATVFAVAAGMLGTAWGAAPPSLSHAQRPTAGRVHSGDVSAWEGAERARDAFEALARFQRTRGAYARVLDGFRQIYHAHPGDMHAAEAVNAVAELLAEEGRDESNAGLLRAAIKQYEFLRTQYPGSSLRVGALLSEAQIAGNDLHDGGAARERYMTFLDRYPRSGMAEQARAALLLLDKDAREMKGAEQGTVDRGQVTDAVDGAQGAKSRSQSTEDRGRAPGAVAEAPGQRDTTAVRRAPDEGAATHGMTEGVAKVDGVALRSPPVGQAKRRDHPAMVTGIRHWSTLSYTRVAIDLGDEVEYEAARVPSPDRIYFDLHGAKLAPELVGKSFAVTDNGFLKKIRVAESNGDLARIVLDVNDVTEYSAFLLPNPYRLIIDIHGRSKQATTTVAEVDAPARPAATVPNTRAMAAGSSADVARLSEQPNRVEATSTPTSQPIAAVVQNSVQGTGKREQQTAREIDAKSGNGTERESGAASGAGPVQGKESKGVPPPADGGQAAGRVGAREGDPRQAALSGSLRRGRKSKVNAADTKVVGDLGEPARAAQKMAGGETSLVRALGLGINRIVIDAGHGGHDSGTLGAGGLEEKDVVLDVALRVGQLLHERLGAEVIYTRSDDTFVPLETRTAIANKAQADLFLSIHANSSPDASARGVETYYLNFTAQPDALEVAARENAVSGQRISQLSDLVKKITLKDKIAESREFATDVESGLYSGLQRGNEGLKNRGVKKAPFVVLIGANMPSVLAEISFVTNPRDAAQLRQPEYRQRVAESLCRGVARYAGGLSGGAPPAVERAAGQ